MFVWQHELAHVTNVCACDNSHAQPRTRCVCVCTCVCAYCGVYCCVCVLCILRPPDARFTVFVCVCAGCVCAFVSPAGTRSTGCVSVCVYTCVCVCAGCVCACVTPAGARSIGVSVSVCVCVLIVLVWWGRVGRWHNFDPSEITASEITASATHRLGCSS